MSFLAALGVGAALFKGVKSAWYKVKKDKPKVKAANVGILQGGMGTGGLPAVPGLGASAATGTAMVVAQGAGGLPVPWWKGPGGKLQMPGSDPRIPEYLKSFALDDAYLKIYYRAPRGYVIVRDSQGRPFAVNKKIAQSFGVWKPAAKPPISATDWKNYKRNQTIEKRLLAIAAPAMRKVAKRKKARA